MDFLGTSQKEAQFPFPWFNCLWNLKSRLLNELLGPIKDFLKRLFRHSNFSWWKILLFEHQKNVETLWIDSEEPFLDSYKQIFEVLQKSVWFVIQVAFSALFIHVQGIYPLSKYPFLSFLRVVNQVLIHLTHSTGR